MKSPMQLLKEVAPEFAQNQMDAKNTLFENDKYQAIPQKYKYLIGIAVASSLSSVTCTNMWVKHAQNTGASKEEIVEAMMVARLLKMATVNDTIASSLENLTEK